MTPSVPVLLPQLILVRLLVGSPDKGVAKRDLDRSLAPFFCHRQGVAAWRQLLEEVLVHLQTQGAIRSRPYRLTEAGRRQALEFLGLESPPPRLNWRTLKNTFLFSRALGLAAPPAPVRQRLAQADGVRAILLRQHYQLPTSPTATLKQVLDALAWKQLGVLSTAPFNRNTVLAYLLSQLLELKGPCDHRQLPHLLVARLVGARRDTVEELRLATIRRWIDMTADQDHPASAGGKSPVIELATFAQHVQQAARSCPTGWFGDNKVFIAHVWRRLQQQPPYQEMDLETFKHYLVEANHQGLLQLSRADLVEAMDSQDVQESETHYLNAVFHFIRMDRRATAISR